MFHLDYMHQQRVKPVLSSNLREYLSYFSISPNITNETQITNANKFAEKRIELNALKPSLHKNIMLINILKNENCRNLNINT